MPAVKKPRAFTRPSVAISAPAGPAREWKHVHPALLAEGDIVADKGKVVTLDTEIFRVAGAQHGYRIRAYVGFQSGEGIGYMDYVDDEDLRRVDSASLDTEGLLTASTKTVYAFTAATPRG